MQSIFLEGLIVARDLVRFQGVDALDKLIEEHKTGAFETTAVVPVAETR